MIFVIGSIVRIFPGLVLVSSRGYALAASSLPCFVWNLFLWIINYALPIIIRLLVLVTTPLSWILEQDSLSTLFLFFLPTQVKTWVLTSYKHVVKVKQTHLCKRSSWVLQPKALSLTFTELRFDLTTIDDLQLTSENFGKSRLNLDYDASLFHRFIVRLSCDKYSLLKDYDDAHSSKQAKFNVAYNYLNPTWVWCCTELHHHIWWILICRPRILSEMLNLKRSTELTNTTVSLTSSYANKAAWKWYSICWRAFFVFTLELCRL